MQIYGNKTVLPQAFKAYDDFVSANKVIRNTTASDQIYHVGKEITHAAETYFEQKKNQIENKKHTKLKIKLFFNSTLFKTIKQYKNTAT